MKLLVSSAILLSVISTINGHGYMVSPPGRNSMWRYKFPNPTNYGDRALNCGGRWKQILNNGRCGICGDAADLQDQPHMDGGYYANNIIGRTYSSGQTITVRIKLTFGHKGYFEFRIGKYDHSIIKGDAHGKLIGHLLAKPNGQTKVPVTGTGDYTIHLKLPENLTCQRCVMQWWYRTGNNNGCDSQGCGLGHGAQEHFVNCADVSIN